MWTWDELWNIVDYHVRERHLAHWRRALAHHWQEGCLAVHGLFSSRWLPLPSREEKTRMSTVETPLVAEAAVGRALLARLDEPTVAAITAALREELRREVHEAAVAEARTTLEQEFVARRERILDDAAAFKAQAQDDAEALLDQQVQAALQDQERDWQDRLDTLRSRLKDARERAQAAESIVVSVFSQLTGGTDQRPVYLHSGGKGLTALDLAAVNGVLRRGGARLRSEASPSPRVVACRLADGRTVTRTRFWLQAVSPSGEVEPDDEDEASTPEPQGVMSEPLALPPA